MSVEEARDLMDTAEKLEHAFAEHFTALIHGNRDGCDTYEEIYEKCKEAIAEQAGPLIWVPTNEPIWIKSIMIVLKTFFSFLLFYSLLFINIFKRSYCNVIVIL